MPTIKVPLFTLCDAATVRDGLINILGGGITALHRDGEYPASIDAYVAGVLTIEGENPSPPRVTLKISSESGVSFGVDDLTLGPEPGEEIVLDEGPIYTIPIIVDVRNMQLPEQGRYRLEFAGEDGSVYSSIMFDAY